MYIFKDMLNKKTSKKIKRVSMKEIVDAFYSGVSHIKIGKNGKTTCKITRRQKISLLVFITN